MAEVFIAATQSEDVQARGLGEALATLGFDVAYGAPGEADVANLVAEAKCVVVLWSRAAAAAPWMTALAVLAQERKKLVSAEFEGRSTPAMLTAAPKIALTARDRAAFKARFQALVVEVDKLTPTKGDPAALPAALAVARGALLKPSTPITAPPWRTLATFALAVAALFAVGFGAGRVIGAIRDGSFLVAAAPRDAEAAPTALAEPRYGVTLAELQTLPWREAAARITADAAERVKADAARGEALAQAVACLGHLTGAEGFLPSPASAKSECDAASAQGAAPGLYLSWVLHTTAAHTPIDAVTARARLAEAARLNWTPAQLDYASLLEANFRGSMADQTEAGRIWLAAAEQDSAVAQFRYARWLRDSPAGPRNPTAATPYLERAAAHDQVEALHMLATLYRDGVGVARDAARARQLYERAAERDHAPSMFNLADLLRSGPDRARAIALYQRLACMPDERQIQPLAVQRLRALRESAACR